MEELGDATDSELTTDATGFFEPVVGGAEDVFVDFDFATVSKDDGEIGVIWVVVYTAECQCQNSMAQVWSGLHVLKEIHVGDWQVTLQVCGLCSEMRLSWTKVHV